MQLHQKRVRIKEVMEKKTTIFKNCKVKLGKSYQ